ncbi:MAG: hypothetical protein MZU91_05545 [Desulfosudis oleivorans]|nr:hypothetical protein [Desulfosudis oleivorans]
MAPYTANTELLHSIFGNLRNLRDSLEKKFNIQLPELSMGMSNDYKIAIQEGANDDTTWRNII